jgi:hypothetical protein
LRNRAACFFCPFLILNLLQHRRHIGPQLAAGFLFGFGQFGERLRVADAGEVGFGLLVLENLHRCGPVVRFADQAHAIGPQRR